MTKKRTINEHDNVELTRGDGGVLQRSFALLEILTDAAHPLSLREISEAVQLNDSSVHRLLQGLCDVGYAEKLSNKRYSATGKAYLPLSVYHPLNALRRDCYQSMNELRDQFGQTVSLVVCNGTERILLEISGAPGVLTPYYDTQLKNPFHAASVGKLVLQRMTTEERLALLGPPPFKAFTPKTIVDFEELEEDLVRVGELGYALSIDENFLGISTIAAPLLLNENRLVGSIVLVGQTASFTDAAIRQMGETLINRCQLISVGSLALRAVASLLAAKA